MVIDCDVCVARDIACDDCVVGVLLGRPTRTPPRPAVPPWGRGRVDGQSQGPVDLDEDESAALGTLAAAGLVPPLRLVRSVGDGPQARPA